MLQCQVVHWPATRHCQMAHYPFTVTQFSSASFRNSKELQHNGQISTQVRFVFCIPLPVLTDLLNLLSTMMVPSTRHLQLMIIVSIFLSLEAFHIDSLLRPTKAINTVTTVSLIHQRQSHDLVQLRNSNMIRRSSGKHILKAKDEADNGGNMVTRFSAKFLEYIDKNYFLNPRSTFL